LSLAVSKTFIRFDEPVVVKILSGENFSHESVQALANVVANVFFSCEIQKVQEDELHFKEMGKRKILLIFPGATDLKKIKLSKEQQEEINFYAIGGMIKVLAVCAGAFFASQTIIYQAQKRHEEKTLCLFRGSCCGPAFESPEPKWTLSAQLLSLEDTCAEKKGYATMIGGGFFVPSATLVKDRDYCVISRYLELPSAPIAALACLPGVDDSFHAALVGPHVEFEGFDESFLSLKKACVEKAAVVDDITGRLSQTFSFRKDLFHHIFFRLGFK
jgi:glutamine amidotransferase-like uncharacterized protein